MNLRRLNLGAMLNCIDIEQTRSINGAAQTLNLSQPALSRSVRSLEDALGRLEARLAALEARDTTPA